ncbi:MAG: fimbrillin family protein [Rikenellaceae bacterium]
MKKIIIAALTVVAMVGCQKNDNQISDKAQNAVEFVSGASTRVNYSGSKWASGDCISITKSTSDDSNPDYVKIDDSEFNVLYTAVVDSGMNVVSFEADNQDEALKYALTGASNFYSYYPYTNSLDGTLYTIDATDQDDSLDFMWASALDVYNDESVVFNFEHKMAKIIFSLYTTNNVTSLNDAKVSITGLKPIGAFDITTGEYMFDDNFNDETPVVTSNTKYATGVFESEEYTPTYGTQVDKLDAQAMVLPQVTTSDMLITIEVSGETYELRLSAGRQFSSGMIYTFNISVGGDSDLYTSSFTISEWGNEVEGDYIFTIAEGISDERQ